MVTILQDKYYVKYEGCVAKVCKRTWLDTLLVATFVHGIDAQEYADLKNDKISIHC